MPVDAELLARIKELSDRAEIHDCMQRYARGIDRKDRALLRSAYHDGAVDDHVGFIVEFNAESQSHITEEVIAIMVGMPTPRQDPTDPSYARPLSAKRPAAL